MILQTLLVLCVASLAKSSCGDGNDTLVLVHTLFRHGNRTIEDNIYDSNPYGDESFWAPYGYNQLTKEGKRTEYKIGKELRKRYDNLLGSEYSINLIDARSTVANRTKMSLLLVLASLYPPSGELLWDEDLNWQPIPYNTFDVDKEIYGRKVCTNYKKAYKKLVKTDDVLKTLEPYQEMFDYLTEKTGRKIQKAKKASDLYLELITQAAYGYPLEDWTSKYMDQMYNITIYNYRLLASTKKLKRLSTGYLLKKIIADSENIVANPTKMFLYSVHEKNIANLLVTLDLFDDMIPTFGSYVLVELHRINNVYGFKFFYQNYRQEEPVLLTVPGCDEFCPIDSFKKLVADFLSDDDYCEVGSDDDDD